MPIAYVIVRKEHETGTARIVSGHLGCHPSFPGMTEQDANALFKDMFANKAPYRTKQATFHIIPIQAKYVKPLHPPGQGTLPADFHEYRRRMGWE